jgi:hypothetical protein
MDERTPGIRPRPSLWRRLDGTARRVFPTASTLLLLLLASLMLNKNTARIESEGYEPPKVDA